jgi:aspartyl-tRNA(Asn)/glutamyl-tRNA(Gln) amidotransferase subunit B
LDYRFTPEPDVPPIVLSDEYVAAIARDTPELPDVAIRRLADVRGDHALPLKLATAVATHASTARYYEAALSAAKRSAAPRDVDVDAAAVARFVVGELTGEVKRASVAGRVEPLLGLPARLSPERVGELLAAVAAGETTARMAKARPMSHWFPYDPVGVVHADP